MLSKMRQRAKDEKGFTLIELLVVILIIGILAAIAIPSFLAQKNKANDASAKELARTAQTTAETTATDNNGSYVGVTLSNLPLVEPTINVNSTTGAAYLLSAAPSTTTTANDGYTVTTKSVPTGNTFTITRSSTGVVQRSCTIPTSGANAGGCQSVVGTTGSW